MIYQYTAAALASGEQGPAPIRPRPTRSRRARTRRTTSRWARSRRATPGRSLEHVERILAIELLVATAGARPAAARLADGQRVPRVERRREARRTRSRAGASSAARRATASRARPRAAALDLVTTARWPASRRRSAATDRRRLRPMAIRIVDVTDDAALPACVPPCADPGFDHRSCDYWEDADRGSKAAAPRWLEAAPPPRRRRRPPTPGQPVRAGRRRRGASTRSPRPAPAGPRSTRSRRRRRPARRQPVRADAPGAGPTVGADAPRKLDAARPRAGVSSAATRRCCSSTTSRAAYAQFGPLSAYPRAQRLRDLYPQLPERAAAGGHHLHRVDRGRGPRRGHARRSSRPVCDDLARRGFAAVEAYPERGARPDATSAATPAFWLSAGFAVAVDDERFPVVRREL